MSEQDTVKKEVCIGQGQTVIWCKIIEFKYRLFKSEVVWLGWTLKQYELYALNNQLKMFKLCVDQFPLNFFIYFEIALTLTGNMFRI